MSLDLRAALSGRLKARALAIAAFASSLATSAGAAPASWTERFAAETDTVLFFSPEGALWKAPFSNATAETLWTPAGHERLTRLAVSPDGARVAWITSGSEQDTVRLWTARTRPAMPRALYFSFRPGSEGRVHYEAAAPTTSDGNARGARFVTSSPRLLRSASTPMAWMPDGSALAFGYSDGVAMIPAESGPAVPAFDLPVVSLECLDPASVFLAEFAAPSSAGGDAKPSEAKHSAWHLLYPAPGRWHAFPVEDIGKGIPWVASSTTLWWARGTEVHTAHAHDPRRTTAAKMRTDVVGLARDRATSAITIAALDEIARLESESAPPRRLKALALPARRMMEDPVSGTLGVVAGDSLVLLQGDSVRVAALKGLDATGIASVDGRTLIWGVQQKSDDPAVAWLEPGAREVHRLEFPRKKGTLTLVPGRRWMLLADTGGKPPGTFHILELSSGTWSEIRNPGIAGWEPLSPKQ